MAYSPPLRIPAKTWATSMAVEQWADNCRAVERWSRLIRCPNATPLYLGNDWTTFTFHAPWPGFDAAKAENTYIAMERWSRLVCQPLYVPFKRWAFEDRDMEARRLMETANWRAVEEWALSIDQCCGADEGGGGDTPVEWFLNMQWYIQSNPASAPAVPVVHPGQASRRHDLGVAADILAWGWDFEPLFFLPKIHVTLETRDVPVVPVGDDDGWTEILRAEIIPPDDGIHAIDHIGTLEIAPGVVLGPDGNPWVPIHIPAGKQVRTKLPIEEPHDLHAYHHSFLMRSAVYPDDVLPGPGSPKTVNFPWQAV